MNAMETFVTDCTFINVGLCELQAIEESMDGVCLMCGQKGRGGWRRLCRGFWHMESSVKVGALEASALPRACLSVTSLLLLPMATGVCLWASGLRTSDSETLGTFSSVCSNFFR